MLLGLLSLISFRHLHAQAIFDTLNLIEFEVIAKQFQGGNTAKSQQLDSIQMREFDQQDLGDLLAAYTPAYVKSYGRGTIATVSFRGAGSSHTQVLWEGFQLNSAMLGQVDFSQVPNAFFTDVELLFGGSTLSNSSGAFGGSVNLSSTTDENKSAEKFQLEQTVGSFNTWLTSGQLNLRFGKLKSLTKVVHYTSDNDFSYYNNAILPFMEMKQQEAAYCHSGFLQHFELPVNQHATVYVKSWNQWFDRDLPPIMTNVFKQQKEYQYDFTSRSIIGWKFNRQKASFEIKGAYFHEYYHYYLNTISNDTTRHIDTKNKINSYYLKGNATTELGNGYIMTTGVDFDHQSVESPNYTSDKVRNTAVVSVSIEKSLFNRLLLKFLLREEYSDQKFSPMLPYFGINYLPFSRDNVSIRWNISKNYKRPTLNELYFYPMGNENLLTEFAIGTEFGVDFNQDINEMQKIHFGISAYYSSIDNWIQWSPGDYTDWLPSNVESVVSKGIETSVKWEGSFNDIRLSAAAQYSYTDTREDMLESKPVQLPYIPVNQVNGFMTIDYHSYYARWNVNYVGERNTTLDEINDKLKRLPAYWLHHLTIGRKFELLKVKTEFRIKLYNIFNVDYQAVRWRAMPGRYVEFSLKLKL